MDFRDMKRPGDGAVRVNRQGGTLNADGNQDPSRVEEPLQVRQTSSRSSGTWILLITVAVVLAVLGFVFRDRLMNRSKTATIVGNSEFQAVFLTNGQVYFGKLSNTQGQYVLLADIYYLQVTPVLQTKTEGQPGSQANPQQQLSLVKLGNELHAPVDKMLINRDQILFFEDLKNDGRVVKAIHEFETPKK